MAFSRTPAPWQPYPHMDFPALRAEHMRDARLYADRIDLIAGLGLAAGLTVGEIGVGLGDFSEHLLRTLQPKIFVGFDTFTLHQIPTLWGKPTTELMSGRTHRAHYESRLAAWNRQLVVEEGPSRTTLARYDAAFFDLLYIDADHRYEAVRRDADLARTRVRPDGVLVFNDYIMFDHLTGGVYGVVPVVNRLVVEDGWQVVGLALQQHMFCDIALRKGGA